MTDRVRALLVTSGHDLLSGDRTGPELADPARGEYRLQAMPLTAEALMAIDLRPDGLAEFLGTGSDLFALADLRTGLVSRS